jgi:hypothetical protein
MGLWFWPRPVDHTARALDFLNSLRHDALVEPWVIGRRRGAYLEDAATLPPGKLAHDWVAARAAKQQLYCLTGEVAGAPKGTVSAAYVLSTRLITVSIPKLRIEQALAFRAAPSILIETERDYAAAWRLHNPVEAYVAGLLAKAVAEALGGVPLPFILPLPGSAGVGRHQYLKGPSNWTLQTDLIRRAPQPAEPAADPVKAPAPFRPSALAVMLGARKAGGDVFWAPFEKEAKLLNSGVLVTGDPGSGKTQTLNVLIDGVAGMGLPVCIFDFKNDYSERGFVQAIGLKVHDVRQRGLPFNPLMPSFNAAGLAQPIEHIFTIAGVLNRVFGLGARQHAVLREAMKEAFERRGIDPQGWMRADACRAPNFDDVIAILDGQKDAHTAGLMDRLAPLIELGLFPKADAAPFEALMDERVVLSLFALPADDIKAALAELIIIRLHGVLVSRPQPRKLTRLLVLDEAWRVAKSKHLENLAREGRAFGAGIAIGTQYPGDLPADLSGALDTKIYLKNQHPDHRKAVLKALCGGNSTANEALQDTLEQLTQFEGLIQNQHYLPYAEFKLTPYFKRARQHAHGRAPESTEEPPRAAWASGLADAPEPVPAAPASASPESAAAKTKDRAGEAARKWLAARLAGGEWHDSANIIGPAFQEKSITKPTLYRARDVLGVVTRKRPDSDRFDWRLPKAGDSQ